MARFRPRPDFELKDLPDEEILAYVQAARAAGEIEEAKTGLQVLVFGYYDVITMRVSLKVPGHAVEEVVGRAFESALKSAFDGTSVGQFRKWLNRITSRRIADWHRGRDPDEAPLPDEHEGDEDVHGPPLAADGGQSAVAVRTAIEEAFEELGPEHRRVVDLGCFQDLPASEVAARIDGMTPDNVYKIAQRFRDRVRDLLYGDDA